MEEPSFSSNLQTELFHNFPWCQAAIYWETLSARKLFFSPFLQITINHMTTQSKTSGHSRLALPPLTFNIFHILGNICVCCGQHIQFLQLGVAELTLRLTLSLQCSTLQEVYFKMWHQILFYRKENVVTGTAAPVCVGLDVCARASYMCTAFCEHYMTNWGH